MKVLIVDGSKESRRDTVEALTQLTNVVILGAVANVRTALHALADAPPDVVVTDAKLPDGDGEHLVERIRRLERSPSIVVLAGDPTEEQRERYLAAGVDRYVGRDAELRSLQEAVVMLGRGRSSIAANDSLRLIGRLAAGASHDMNNYLAAATGLVGLLQRNPTDPSLWTQLNSALDAISRVNGTVLSYASGASPAPEVLDIGAIVQAVLALAAQLVPPTITVTTDITPNLRPIRGVASDLEQLVLNLVINACDAMPDGGVLHVAVTPTASAAVHLRIADSGHGLQRVSKREGRGLGLGIVRAVVERQQGALHFADRPGGGTVVDVMLPAP
jgi:signal transduction histidine kinase